jgi:hypothetical protein
VGGNKWGLTAPLPVPVLSFLTLAAIPDTGFPLASSFDHAELVPPTSWPLDDDPTDIPEPEPDPAGVPGVAPAGAAIVAVPP